MENHNMSKSRIYGVWRAMKKRCYRENDKEYKSYGGRGIKVCDNWKNSFLNFYNWSIENGYTEETMPNNRNRLTLDRINNDGNYEPSNCRWVTRDEQDKNRANNFIVEFKGKQYTISELSEMCDIDRTTLYERVAFLGWEIEDAMTRPIRKIKGKKKEFMDKYYLIRDKKSGAYLLKGREWTKDVELATRYKSKKLAERSISNSYLMALMDCEVVELPSRVEIFADLEAKLELYEQSNKVLNDQINKSTDHICELNDKLAESEKNFVVANNLRKNSDEVLLNYKTEKYGLDKTIQELRKIKLSFPEKEWYYKGFENCERQMSSHIADLTLEVKELQQQLAEKEKEIDNLYNRLNSKQKFYEMSLEKDYKEYLSRLDKLEKQCDQDKISFAVEQLEWLKNKIPLMSVQEIIDGKIWELTHQRKDKGE